MRMAYVCADPGVPVFGCKGCSIHVQEVMRALLGQGAQIDLFAARFDNDPPTDLQSICCHHLPELPCGDTVLRERAALDGNHSLTSALQRRGPFDFIYERYSLWSYAGMEYAEAVGIPGLLEVNAPLVDEQANYRGLHDRAGAEAVARRVFNAASHLIAVSVEVRNYLQEVFDVAHKTSIIANGVDVLRFSPQCPARLPSEPGVVTIGFVGTLKPWHGVEDLLDAFTRLIVNGLRVRLLIVGDGPIGPLLRNCVRTTGLESVVHFIGNVPPAEMPGWLTSMDVAVAPYPDRTEFYFSPLKVFEYMAAGRAIVGSRIGQMTEVLVEGKTVRFCRPGDPADLAEVLTDLCVDAQQRMKLGSAARTAAVQRHSWKSVAKKTLALAGFARESTQLQSVGSVA